MGYLLLLLLQGCPILLGDPGITLHPSDWEESADFEWRLDTDHMGLRTGTMGGLIGRESVGAEFHITNHTDHKIVFEAAELTTRGQTYAGALLGGEKQSQIAAPKAAARITVAWHFAAPIYKIFGDDALIALHLRVGDRSEAINIRYERGS